jgi:hypothetical protein
MNDDKRLRVSEAILWAKKRGIKVVMQELAVKTFPEAATLKSAVVCLDNVRTGRTVTLTRLQIIAMAEYLQTTPDRILGWEEEEEII